MNINQLECFVSVAKSKNITQSAKKLYISQQALSTKIIKLEKELNTKLFHRSPKLTLTESGELLLKKAKIILETENDLKNNINDINSEEKGVLTVGISHTRGRVFLPMVLPLFYHNHKNIQIILKEGNSTALRNLMEEKEVDIIIAAKSFSNKNIECEHLVWEKLFWLVPKKLVEEKNIKNIKDVYKLPFVLMNKDNRIRAIVDNYFEKNNIDVNIILETDNIETSFSLSSKGLGVTVYPEMFMKNLLPSQREPFIFLPLEDRETESELVVAYSKNMYLRKYTKEFIELCSKICKE